ncbi:MAG: metal-dependent hydrolase [Desulfarculaceae bacterium]|jgi:L-ascorbate metabolism protein UlaG (beta-lactamase superfamily)
MAKGSIRWLGHSFVEFTTAEGKVVLFDPWTKEDGNPGAEITLDQIEKADLVLISHDHLDHLGSAVAICEKTGALLGGGVQTVARLQQEGFDTEKVANFGAGYMVGGGVALDWVKVIATQALHSSDTACALGHIVQASDGTTVYHAGDTGIFGDMELLGKLYPLDLACLPMGGIFTMDAYQASHAAAMLKPAMVLPIHYGSFPIIAQTPEEFVGLAAQNAPGIKVLTPSVGEQVVLG